MACLLGKQILRIYVLLKVFSISFVSTLLALCPLSMRCYCFALFGGSALRLARASVATVAGNVVKLPPYSLIFGSFPTRATCNAARKKLNA